MQECRLTVTGGDAVISVPGKAEGPDVEFKHDTAVILKFTVKASSAGTVTIEARCGDCPKPTPIELTAIKITLAPERRAISAKSECPQVDPKETKTRFVISTEPAALEGEVEIALGAGKGTVTQSTNTEAVYEAFQEPLGTPSPASETATIVARVGGVTCAETVITVRSAFESLVLPAIQKSGTPGSGGLFDKVYEFIRCKYRPFLGGIKFKDEDAFFFQATVADTRTVRCPIGLIRVVDADACTTGRVVIFGQNAFSSEAEAVSTIAHELLHTAGANEKEALQFELDNAAVTGISPAEIANIEARLREDP